MAMPVLHVTLTEAQRQELRAALRVAPDARTYKRMTFVELSDRGYTVQALAELFDLHEQGARSYLHAYATGARPPHARDLDCRRAAPRQEAQQVQVVARAVVGADGLVRPPVGEPLDLWEGNTRPPRRRRSCGAEIGVRPDRTIVDHAARGGAEAGWTALGSKETRPLGARRGSSVGAVPPSYVA